MKNIILKTLAVGAIGGFLVSFNAAENPSLDQTINQKSDSNLGEIDYSVAKDSKAQIVTVASKVSFNAIVTNQSDLSSFDSSTLDGLSSNKIVIHKPGASFVKVHFSSFTIPDGAYVTVKNRLGSQAYQYSNGNQTPRTYDQQIGEDGIHQFSALSIVGDTAIVEWSPGTSNDDDYRIEIDYVMEGYPESTIQQLMNDPIGTRSTCGVNERKDVKCWANSHPTEYERTRPVARLLMNGSGLCTGWRVGSDNHMFTNNHCVSTQSGVTNTEVWFNYQNTSCGGSTREQTTIVSGASMLKTDYTLDYTVFTVTNFSSINSFGYFGLDVRDATSQEVIYIPQHGSGNPKELSIESDQNTGNLCRIDHVLSDGRGTDTDMGYMCDTIGGSSGSPVLARSTNNVIALHHFGGCPNQGVRIKEIWPQVSSIFGGVIPVGDNATPGGDPVANFSFTTSELTASFNDSSTDNGGSIVSRSWNFGDGATSSAQNPSHTYGSAGSYAVSLTVTDNDGNTNTKTQTVVVSSSGDNELVKGVPVTGISGAKDAEVFYYFDMPEGNFSNLTFNMSGGSGDADIYLKFGEKPTKTSYDCRPYKNGNTETCAYSGAGAGRYHVLIVGYSAFSGVQVVADYTEVSDGDGIEHTNLSGTRGNWKHYTLEVPAGKSALVSTLSGGTGDADLYVRFGSQPTTSQYDCRPYKSGNNETCTQNNPQAGTWYISVRAYSTYSGVTVKANSQ